MRNPPKVGENVRIIDGPQHVGAQGVVLTVYEGMALIHNPGEPYYSVPIEHLARIEMRWVVVPDE